MLKNLRKKAEGFTIIEVLIVLAIAGLILLIVFLAVPALQRSAKNTQRKTDATAIATAISNFESNNNGQLPDGINIVTTAGINNAVVSCTGVAGGTCTPTPNTEQAKMGYFTTGTAIFEATIPAKPPALTVTGASLTNGVAYYMNADCGSASGTVVASTGSFAITYALDSGNSIATVNCVD